MTNSHETEGNAPQPGEDNIVRAMARTAHAARRYLETTVTDVPGGMSAWPVVRMLHKCGPTTQADLARWVGVAGSTLTRRLDQMEDDGLITRADDPDDKRRIIVTLAPAAEKLITEQHSRMEGEIGKITAGADPADIEAMTRVIAKIRENLDALGVDVDWKRGGRGRGPGGGRHDLGHRRGEGRHGGPGFDRPRGGGRGRGRGPRPEVE